MHSLDRTVVVPILVRADIEFLSEAPRQLASASVAELRCNFLYREASVFESIGGFLEPLMHGVFSDSHSNRTLEEPTNGARADVELELTANLINISRNSSIVTVEELLELPDAPVNRFNCSWF